MLSFRQFLAEMSPYDSTYQPWGTAGTADSSYQQAMTLANEKKSRFQQILARAASGRGKILIGIKSLIAWKSKLSRGKAADQIHDILRGAILLNTQDEVEDVVAQLKRSQTIHAIEFKNKGSDPAYGYYGSWHIKLVVDKLICEVQVMTRRLWTYKDLAHDFYNEYRDKGDEVPAAVIAQSKAIFARGNQRSDMGKGPGRRPAAPG